MKSRVGGRMSKLCPKCGQELNLEAFCENCNISFHIYDKIKATSKLLYNQGLQFSKVRDLSAAINTLQKSIRLDKKNIDARNLLGLVYFEIGETILAFQQWVISKNLQPNDNIAETYLKNIQENQTYLEKLNTAIKRYNQALQHISQNSEDLAVIQLKKAISLNPKFIKSYLLLALCYINEDQIQKAQAILQKVLAIDKNNYIARKYYDDITEKEPVQNKEEIKENININKNSKKWFLLSYNSSFQQVILIAAGAIIGLAVALFLISPNKIKSQKNEISLLKEQAAIRETELKDISSKLQNEIERNQILENDKEQLDSELNAARGAKNAASKILVALNYKDMNDYEKAAEAIYSIDSSSIEDSEINDLYLSLKKETYEKAALNAYNLGYGYRNSDYEKAIEQFDLSLKLVQDAYYSDRALYYRALTHLNLLNYEAAKKDFNLLITNYPNSSRVADAKYQLSQLQ